MLEIKIPLSEEQWDDKTEMFVEGKTCTIRLEHSLVSVSKWESKWHKSFLNTKNLTDEEILDYIKFMTITQNVDPEVYDHLTGENIQQINDYIKDPMTATYFHDDNKKGTNRKVITSELIYCWMISLNIPSEYQKWHLNRLITLIRVCNNENQPPNSKKMSKSEILRRNAAVNAANRAKFNSKG